MLDRRVGALWSVFGITAVTSSVLVMLRPVWDRLSDLHIYLGAVEAVQNGRPLYEYAAANGGPFTYPPFAILALWPIASPPEPVVQVIWLVLTCAAVAATAAAIGGVIANDPRKRPVVIAAAACALMISAPAQSNLRFGQVSIFIVLFALIDGMGLTPARYRGLLVGVAAAVKLTPLLFVLFFLVSRRYRDAGRAMAAFAVCTVIAAVALPSDSWTFWTGTLFKTSRIGDLASLGNQSLHGILLRVGVAGSMLPLLWAGLIAVICGVALLRARRIQLGGQPARAAVLVGCATVAASPVSWTHHQIWPVLAAMLLIGTEGVLQRVMGGVLLATMTLSLGVLLSDVSTLPGWQFLLENARALAVVAICLAGLGGVAVAVASSGARARAWPRVATTVVMALALFAVLPLPAGADPTFKAYTLADAHNPRYFFACRSDVECAVLTTRPVNFGIAKEKTKMRVSGVVDSSVTRLEYKSAPGGPPRTIPLIEIYPGQRSFAFRCANLANGHLVAYAVDGSVLATYTDVLTRS